MTLDIVLKHDGCLNVILQGVCLFVGKLNRERSLQLQTIIAPIPSFWMLLDELQFSLLLSSLLDGGVTMATRTQTIHLLNGMHM